MNFNDIPVYIINLPKHTDRKLHMINLMKKLNFKNYTFIIPYEPSLNTKLELENFFNTKINLSLTKCSHTWTYINLLKNIQDDKCFIFEDDIKLIEDLDSTINNLQYVVNYSPTDASLVYLELCLESDCNWKQSINNFYILNKPLCCAAIYYPSKILRKKIIEIMITKTYWNYAMDQIFISLNKLIKYYLYQIIFIQDNKFGSSLEGSIGYNLNNKPELNICKWELYSPSKINYFLKKKIKMYNTLFYLLILLIFFLSFLLFHNKII